VTSGRAALIVRASITVAVLGWVTRSVEPAAARDALGAFSPPLVAAALALVGVDRLLMLQRWMLLIRPTTALSNRMLARIFFVSSFLGSFMPAGVGGDAVRAWTVTRHTGRGGAAAASVIADRWLGLLAVGVTGCLGMLFSLTALPASARPLLVVATLLLLAGGLGGLYADRVVVRLLPVTSRRFRVAQALLRVSDAMASYRTHGATLLQVAGLSVAVQANRIVLAWVLGLGLGLTLPFSYYWVFMPLNILVILLPLSIGGFGLPQGAMIWTLAPLGVDATAAFLLSTLFVGIGIIGNLPGAWMYLRGADQPSQPAQP